MGILNLVPFHLIWGNDELRAVEKEGSLTMTFQSMLTSGSWGC
jgi:hypothetical protein